MTTTWKKVINKSGGWYTYEDVKLGQGKIKAKESLEANTFLDKFTN